MSEPTASEIESILFLLLYSRGPKGIPTEPVPSNMFVQKQCFVVSRRLQSLEADYQPFRLGPFSETLDEAVEQLRMSQLITVEDPVRLTDKGMTIAEQVWHKADSEMKGIVEETKRFINDMTKDELLVFVYTTFPEWTENSDIKEEIEKKRVPVALVLFSKRKVSLGKAAAIAGLTVRQFSSLLEERNIPTHSYSQEEIGEELSTVDPSRP